MNTSVELRPGGLVERLDDGLHHGAHVACQVGAPFVVLVCGLAADWDERVDVHGLEQCPMCWNGDQCPVCGMRLERP